MLGDSFAPAVMHRNGPAVPRRSRVPTDASAKARPKRSVLDQLSDPCITASERERRVVTLELNSVDWLLLDAVLRSTRGCADAR